MKTTIKNTIEAITEHLENLSNSELVSIHNEACQSAGSGDEEIYTNDEDFFNTYFDGKVIEAVRAVSFGDYQYSHEFIMFDGYGNLQTFNDPSDHISITDLAEDIKENPENFYDIELEDEEEENEEA